MAFVSRRQADYLRSKDPKAAAEKEKGTDWESLPDTAADKRAADSVRKKLKAIAERKD